MYKLKPSCELEGELFKNVYDKTPDYIKNLDLMNFDNKDGFTFTLKREHLPKYPLQVLGDLRIFCFLRIQDFL